MEVGILLNQREGVEVPSEGEKKTKQNKKKQTQPFSKEREEKMRSL